jgi:hypothetical protein
MNSRRTKPLRLAIAVCAAVMICSAGSCSVSQDVSLDREGRGTADITVTLKPVLVRYFTDLLQFAGDDTAGSIFDENAVRQAFSTIPELDLLDVEVVSKGELRLAVAFSDIEEAFFRQVGSDVHPAAEVTRSNDGWKTSLYLDTDNYTEIVDRMLIVTGMVMFEDYLTGLLAPGPEDVIIDMYEYAFEDYLQGESVEKLLNNSEIVLRFTTPEEVLGHRGGKAAGRNITYRIPLLDILTLDKPLSYHFLYR